MPQSQSIMIVEDESIVALDLKHQLIDLGYEVSGIAASGEQAIRMVAGRVPNLILMDVRLQGDLDGIDVASTLRKAHDVPVIFLTSHSDDDTVRRAARTAPYGYLTKPYQIRELRAGIEVALAKAHLERQLREADRWFAHTLQCVTDGVVVTDADARVRFLNPVAEGLTGWRLDDAVGRDVGEIVRTAPGSQPGRPGLFVKLPAHDSISVVRSAIQLGRPTPVSYALELTARDGRVKLVDQSVGPVTDDDGKPLGAVLILHDATVRVAQETLLRSSEERFRNAFDHAPLGMALVALSGAILQANGALCRMLNSTAEALKQLSHGDLGADADDDHEIRRLRELLIADRGVVQFERRYKRLDSDAPVCALVSVSLLHDDEQPTCYLFQIHDLTEQRAAAEHLAALADERMKRRASELASTAKSEFLSRVSHEMRTPLNAVIGFASLMELQVSAADAKTGVYAHHIRAAGEHMLAMVTDLLDLNRAAAGTLNLELQPVRLAASVTESMQMLEPLGQAHGIDLQSSVGPDVHVIADRVRLQQVLLNVLSNAIKYNRQGGAVQLSADTTTAGKIRLSVRDEGIGMTTAQMERLFNPFDRLGQERTKTPGTGLGLVIARGIVSQMDGTLDVASEPRIGTTVSIELPAAA